MTYQSDSLPPEFAEAFEAASRRLPPLGSQIKFFNALGSTNDVASALASEAGAEGAIVIADQQTAGRGRYGRKWFSPPSSGLYVSVVLMPFSAQADPGRATSLLTLAAGVALAEALESATGLRADIKWPNDVVVGRRKLAGILAESVGAAQDLVPDTGGSHAGRRDVSTQHVMSVVVGYGINVGATAYPPELGDRATSVESELGQPTNRATLCVETLAALSRRYRDLLSGRFDAILDAWRGRAPSSTGRRVSWSTPSGPRSGVTAGIDERGALLIRVGDRTDRIVAGEITWA